MNVTGLGSNVQWTACCLRHYMPYSLLSLPYSYYIAHLHCVVGLETVEFIQFVKANAVELSNVVQTLTLFHDMNGRFAELA